MMDAMKGDIKSGLAVREMMCKKSQWYIGHVASSFEIVYMMCSMYRWTFFIFFQIQASPPPRPHPHNETIANATQLLRLICYCQQQYFRKKQNVTSHHATSKCTHHSFHKKTSSKSVRELKGSVFWTSSALSTEVMWLAQAVGCRHTVASMATDSNARQFSWLPTG